MGKGLAMVGYPLRSLVVLYRMLIIFIKYEVINVSDTVSGFIRLHTMLLSKYCFFEIRIGQVTMTLLFI